MQQVNTYKLLIIIFFIFLSVLLFFFYKYSAIKPPIAPAEKDNFRASVEKAKWKIFMQSVGPEKTYAAFKQAYEHSSYGRQHVAIHTIGELLYEIYGIQGLPTCDNSFAFGCYHGFFGAAIQDKGLSQLTIMDDACIKKFGLYGTGCQHGMGHGIMAYLGNDKLREGLQQCDKLKRKTMLGGCKGGIFMEYNFFTLRHDKSAIVRTLDPAKPYAPCDTLPTEYQYACYFSQPEWWNNVYDKNAKKIGDLCEALHNTDNKRICYLGLGSIAGQTMHYNIDQTIGYCNEINSETGRSLCKAGASWTYTISFQHLTDIHKICDSEPTQLQKTCMKDSQGIQ